MYLKQLKSAKLLAILLGISASSIFMIQKASAFSPLDTIGKGTIDIHYSVDDTKGITNYAGVDNVQVCIDCKDSLNLNYTMSKNGRAVTNLSNKKVSRVNKDSLGYFSYSVPSETKEGKHWVCLQTEDDTVKTINGVFQKGNTSLAQEEVSCKRFFYDISAPVATNIVLNDANKFTNHDVIHATMDVSDNYAGLRSIKYPDGYGKIRTIPADDIKCSRNTSAGANEGKWSCKVDTMITLNSDRAEDNVVFTLEDKVGNVINTTPVNIKFDKVIPIGSIKIHEDGNGVVNSNTAYVDYAVKDPSGNPWIYPSGLVNVTLSQMDGSNPVVLLNDPDLTKDKTLTLGGTLEEYLLTTCDDGPVKLKLYVKDRAGNESKDKIISNEVTCSKARISRFDVTNVINPKIYTESIPFTTLSWVFKEGNATEGMKDGKLAPLLAGANSSFEFDVEWSGDINATATARYTIYVRNEKEGYEKSFDGELQGSPFIAKPNGLKYSTFKDTVTMPKDAPSSKINSQTDVTIKIDATITSIEGNKNKVNKSAAKFDKNGNEALWGKIVGSIDDYLYFGETN